MGDALPDRTRPGTLVRRRPARHGAQAVITIEGSKGFERFAVSSHTMRLVRRVLRGDARTRPLGTENTQTRRISGEGLLTTTQAAALLGVSRPYLIRLLEAGKLPYHRVGTHRRLRQSNVEIYRDRMQGTGRKALRHLAEADQQLGLE